jgi:hypothetical protein
MSHVAAVEPSQPNTYGNVFETSKWSELRAFFYELFARAMAWLRGYPHNSAAERSASWKANSFLRMPESLIKQALSSYTPSWDAQDKKFPGGVAFLQVSGSENLLVFWKGKGDHTLQGEFFKREGRKIIFLLPKFLMMDDPNANQEIDGDTKRALIHRGDDYLSKGNLLCLLRRSDEKALSCGNIPKIISYILRTGLFP